MVPSHYALQLTFPDPNAATSGSRPLPFAGTVSITAAMRTATTCITLHAGTGLTITGQ